MQVFEYILPDGKEKGRAADIASILQDMSDKEDFGGLTEARIYEHWYAMKRELAEAMIAEMPEQKEEKK